MKEYTQEQLNIAQQYDDQYIEWDKTVEKFRNETAIGHDTEAARQLIRVINETTFLERIRKDAEALGLNPFTLHIAICALKKQKQAQIIHEEALYEQAK